MSRHLADHRADSRAAETGARLTNFCRIARAEAPHPSSRDLHRRPLDREGASGRIEHYLRIERGVTA